VHGGLQTNLQSHQDYFPCRSFSQIFYGILHPDERCFSNSIDSQTLNDIQWISEITAQIVRLAQFSSIMPSHSSTRRVWRLVHASKRFFRRRRSIVRIHDTAIRDKLLQSTKLLYLSGSREHGLTHLIVNSTRERRASAHQSLALCSLQWLSLFTFIRNVSDNSSTTRFHLTSFDSPKGNWTGLWKSKLPDPASIMTFIPFPKFHLLVADYTKVLEARVTWSKISLLVQLA